MRHDCKHMCNCTCATLRVRVWVYMRYCKWSVIASRPSERGASTARLAGRPSASRLQHRCRNGIVLDLVQCVDVRANRVPWLQQREGMRTAVSAAAAPVRDTIRQLHAAEVLHLAVGWLLPQAGSALDNACARSLCTTRAHEDHFIQVRSHKCLHSMCPCTT